MKKLSTIDFIKRAINVHGDKYDYSNVNYINNRIKVKLNCKIHGIFEQRPTRHLCGDGCPKCNGGVKIFQEDFIKNAKKIHNNVYEYSLVNYINSKTKIDIICPEHGIFKMKPNHHLLGQGCSECDIKNKTLTIEQFIEKTRKVHGNIYDYSLVDYKYNNIKIKIICREHGIFEQTPHAHLQGRGCPQCKIRSNGELIIRDWLNMNEIKFEVQKSFTNCKNVFPLRYDFYLPKYNMLIEYDGEPHFKEVAYLGGSDGLKYRQQNDKIKTDYAINCNFNLLRIKYTERNNLSEILKNNIIII